MTYPTRGDPTSRHLWEIQASEEVHEGGRTYWGNLHTGVVTTSMERAIDLFRDEHPDAVLHRVERRNYFGTQRIIIDPEVTAEPFRMPTLPPSGAGETTTTV